MLSCSDWFRLNILALLTVHLVHLHTHAARTVPVKLHHSHFLYVSRFLFTLCFFNVYMHQINNLLCNFECLFFRDSVLRIYQFRIDNHAVIGELLDQ